MVKTHVCILGGGVGGLAAAHSLAKTGEFSVMVIERNASCGGQARSASTPDGKHTEYCWHMISNSYQVLPSLLKDIPGTKKTSVFDHLRPLKRYLHLEPNQDPVIDEDKNFLNYWATFLPNLSRLTGKTHACDAPKILGLFLYSGMIAPEHLEELDNISWDEYTSNLSPEMRQWILGSTSIYLGMDYKKLSAHTMMDLLRHNAASFDPSADFFAFDGPINEVWFDPWQRFLESTGVRFFMNTSVTKIQCEGKTVTELVLKSGDGVEYTVTADYVINAMGVESLAKLYPSPNEDFKKLNELATQTQTQVLYHFNYRIPEPATTAYIWGSSPWFLMGRVEGGFWDLEDEDYLSVGIGKWDVPGLNGKTATECTREELARDCWDQMMTFGAPSNVGSEMPEWDVWYSFEFDPKAKKMHTWEPKFSNNVGTLKLRPSTSDKRFWNFKHATAYTRTEMNLFNMDSAAEAGVRAAQSIIEEKDVPVGDLYTPSGLNRCLYEVDKLIWM